MFRLFVCFIHDLLHLAFNKNVDTELDEESDENVTQHEQTPGVDDAFFVGNGSRTDIETDDADEKHNHNHEYDRDNNNHVPNGNPPFPYAPGYGPNVVSSA